MTDFAFIAVIQPQWKRYQNETTLRDDLSRFLRLSRTKGANIALFPELTGLMLSGPLAAHKPGLVKQQGSLLNRLLHSFSGPPELADVLPSMIADHSEELTEYYSRLFGGLAREHRMIVIGGTLLARSQTGAPQYRAGVFSSEGELMGWQPKLHLNNDEIAIAEPGDLLQTFDAPFGRFGVLVGQDILFPELARALAYRGCIGIFHTTLACGGDDWRRQRLVASARAQENQIYIAQSFFVGQNDIFAGDSGPLVGRSSVLTPVELSPRGDGLLTEVGSDKVEGFVVGEWNTAALTNLWQSSDAPVRRIMRPTLFYSLLAADYASGETIADRANELGASGQGDRPTPRDREEVSLIAPSEQPVLLGAPLYTLPPSPISEASLSQQRETDDLQADTSVEAPPHALQTEEHRTATTRSAPVIDPDTGRYLGERQLTERS